MALMQDNSTALCDMEMVHIVLQLYLISVLSNGNITLHYGLPIQSSQIHCGALLVKVEQQLPQKLVKNKMFFLVTFESVQTD